MKITLKINKRENYLKENFHEVPITSQCQNQIFLQFDVNYEFNCKAALKLNPLYPPIPYFLFWKISRKIQARFSLNIDERVKFLLRKCTIFFTRSIEM